MRGFSPCLVHQAWLGTSKYFLYSMLLSLCAHYVWVIFSRLARHWKVEKYVRTTRRQFNVELLCYRITVRVVD
ncbi:hypothetical protein MtrunA17_Chr3g0132321 [Medicago truncatula]|uniref:Transmembrane protein n=1 Tax=Medicago truncatula TaxID=3880 RepID=I3T3V8_MEDTR|nr:unknown [Medicago truncatula]RHN70134.1 hypothetical protein MtrunA17_Chr3g0132321 [Medicago truncatula]